MAGGILWEQCDNRTLHVPHLSTTEHIVLEVPHPWFELPPLRLVATLAPRTKALRLPHIQITSLADLSLIIPPAYAPRDGLSVETPATEPLAKWWERDQRRAATYYTDVLGRHDTPPHPMPAWLARDIINRTLHLPAAVVVIPIEDWLLACAPTGNVDTHALDNIQELISLSGRC